MRRSQVEMKSQQRVLGFFCQRMKGREPRRRSPMKGHISTCSTYSIVHSYRTMMQECGRHVSAKFQLATFGDDTTKSTRVFPRTG